MKKVKFIVLAAWTCILPILFLTLDKKNTVSAGLGADTIPAAERQPVLEATVQILAYPQKTLDALGVTSQEMSLKQAIANAEVEYRYKLGIGTLIRQHGEVILVTHDHWGSLDEIGLFQFRNALGEPLLEIDVETFKDLVRYQDSGTMILGGSAGEDHSDYISAMVWISQSKYGTRIQPAELGSMERVSVGQTLIVARQDRQGAGSVELIFATVEYVGKRWGQPVYKLRTTQGENIMPGDSGGGLWLGGVLVGNMWKSKYTYRMNWESLKLEQAFTETSYAAGLPDSMDEILQNINPAQHIQLLDIGGNGGEY
jgi:hypothetical protein